MSIMYEEKKLYPTNAAQKAMVMERKLLADPLVYNLCSLFKLIGAVDNNRFKQAFKKVIEHQPETRASFVEEEGEVYQKIADTVSCDMPVYTVETIEEVYELKNQLNKPFDLRIAPIFRTAIIEKGTEKYFFFSCHHAIGDGVGVAEWFQEILDVYSGKELKEIKATAIDYAIEEQENRNNEDFAEKEKYWVEMYKDGVPSLEFPLDKARPVMLKHKGKRLIFDVDEKLTSEIKQVGRKNKATPFSVMLAAYSVLVARYSGKEDIVVGVPFAGRKERKYARTIGMFVNNLPWRVKAEAGKSFDELVKEIEAAKELMNKNQEYPIAKLVEKLNLPVDTSHNSMFDIVFNFVPAYGAVKSDALAMEFVRDDEDPAISDIAFRVNKQAKSYYIELIYSEALFNKETMEQFSQDYLDVLEEISEESSKKIAELRVMNEAERKLLKEFNNTECEYNKDLTMVDLLEKNVELYPERYAVKAKDRNLTYQEFDKETNKIANGLNKQGIGKGDIVAFMLPRTSELLCVMYGIMKSGAAFLPIDPDYPAERIEHVLNDSHAKYIVIEDKAKKEIAEMKQAIKITEIMSSQEAREVSAKIAGSDLCYMIYTSGSTGKPKGVMIEHRNVVNFSQPLERNTLSKEIAESSKVAIGIGTIAFDIALSEIFPAIANGLTLVLADEITVNQPDMLGKLMKKEEVEVLQITPSRLIPFLENAEFAEALGKLKVLLSAAEVFTPDMLKKIRKLTKAAIINGYGPSETAIGASFAKITGNEVTIGKPISNVEIHILDKQGKEVPIGVLGELCIGGAGVGRGYYNREELTNEKFREWNGKRIYHTGDIAAWRRDGNIAFKGRVDDLVKLRGLRIELGEIETAIREIEGIERAVVLVQKIGETEQLCAYYQAKQAIEEAEIKSRLGKKLVYYMIPNIYVKMEKFPITPNGKIDKKALPIPEMKAAEKIQPANKIEEELYELVSQLLKTKEFGVTSNLFSIGMTSILGIKLSVASQKQLGLKIATKDILTKPTIREIAKQAKREETAVKTYEKREYYPLTENQKGLYVEWEKNREALQYNVPMCLKFAKLDSEKLKEALIAVVEAHPYLKTKLKLTEAGEIVQVRRDEAAVEIVVEQLAEEPEEGFFKGRVKAFDLLKDSLYRIEFYETFSSTYLFIDIHHIVYDGSAMNVLFGDLAKAYSGEEISQEEYTAYDKALAEEEMLKSDKYKEAEKYFNRLLSETESTKLEAINKAEGKGKAKQGKIIIDREEIENYCKNNKVTENSFFLTIFTNILSRITGNKTIQIATISSGRGESYLENVIGMFVKTIPVVYKESDKEATEEIKELQEQLFATIGNEIYPYTALVEKNGISTNINYVYEGGMGGSFRLGESKSEPVELELDTAKFPLNLIVAPEEAEYELVLEYDDSIYNEKDTKMLLKAMKILMGKVVANSEKAIKELEIVTAEQKTELLKLGEGEKIEYDKTGTIIDVFRQQAAKTPEATAIIYKDIKLTYKELDEKTDQIAKYLVSLGVKEEEAIGVMIDRSEYMAIYPIAITKAGAAYMPLDYSFPEDRLSYMLEDAKVEIILSEGNRVEETIGEYKGKVVKTEELAELNEAGVVELPKLNPEKMFVILYTSGSTGKPKGCVLEHRNIINFCKWYQKEFDVTEKDCSSAYANFGFDCHMLDMYPLLTCGGRVCIVPSEIRLDLAEVNQYLEKYKVSIGFFTTQVGRQFVEFYENKTLRLLSVAGEKLATVKKPAYRFYNGYGPTECTVYATFYNIEKDYDSALIGKALGNYQLYVLDSNQKLQPQGVAGELCVGGAGVGRGYLNREELTAEKFIKNPFENGEDGDKLYRTGDLVRWSEDGNIEYLGRMDRQVKLRGLRIELGEIESKLASYPEITGAAVEIKEINGTKQLCAYFTAGKEIVKEELESYLAETLTEYMVPTAYLQMDKLPLNPNGKVDRKALPQISIVSEEEYEAPINEIERSLAKIAAEILQVEKIGRKDSFFGLGGDSIKAIRLTAKLRQNGYETTVAAIMKNKTIKKIAEQTKKLAEKAVVDNEPVWSDEEFQEVVEELAKKGQTLERLYPMTEMQKSMVILAQISGKGYYHEQSLCKITKLLDANKFKERLKKITQAHEVLRTWFYFSQGNETMAIVNKEAEIDFIYQDITSFSKEAKQNFIKTLQSIDKMKGFDFSKTPLFRAILVRLNNKEQMLLLSMSHAIMDGWSMSIVMGQLFAETELIEKSPSNGLYAEWLAKQDKEEAKEYWGEYLKGINRASIIKQTANGVSEQALKSFVIGEAQVEKINEYCKKQDITISTYIQLAWGYSLMELMGAEDVVFGYTVSGRPGEIQGIDKMVGNFINTIPIRIRKYKSKEEELKNVQAENIKIQKYSYLSLGEIQKIAKLKYPLFDHFITFQNLPSSNGGNVFNDISLVNVHNKSIHHFSITIMPSRRLEILMSYDSGYHTAEQIQEIAEIFKGKLEN